MLKVEHTRSKLLSFGLTSYFELHRLRSIRREIRKEEEQHIKRLEQRKKEKEEKMYKPAILSRYKYEPPPIEVNFSDEITGSLRSLKTEGNASVCLFDQGSLVD